MLEANARREAPPAEADVAEPAAGLAVLTCMDARIEPFGTFGLRPGDAHVVRNAGAVATEDAIRSLVLSHQKMAVTELAVIGHTRCGLCGLDEEGLRGELEARTGEAAETPRGFAAFEELEGHVAEQVRTVRAHPWLAQLTVRGFVYEVETGRLREVEDGAVNGSGG